MKAFQESHGSGESREQRTAHCVFPLQFLLKLQLLLLLLLCRRYVAVSVPVAAPPSRECTCE